MTALEWWEADTGQTHQPMSNTKRMLLLFVGIISVSRFLGRD